MWQPHLAGLLQLATFINHQTFTVASDVFVKPRAEEDRRVAVHGMIKKVYTVVFHWLVAVLNESLGETAPRLHDKAIGTSAARRPSTPCELTVCCRAVGHLWV